MSNLDIFVRYHVRLNRKVPVGARCDRHVSRPAVQKDWDSEDQCWQFSCQKCLNQRKAYFGAVFQNPEVADTDYCEGCNTNKPKFLQLIHADGERDVEKEFRDYKDPEDSSMSHLCRSCYSERSASDAAYWAEPEDELDDDLDDDGDSSLSESELMEESRVYDEAFEAQQAQQAAEQEAWEKEDGEREEMEYWENYSRELRQEWDMAQARLTLDCEGRTAFGSALIVYKQLK